MISVHANSDAIQKQMEIVTMIKIIETRTAPGSPNISSWDLVLVFMRSSFRLYVQGVDFGNLLPVTCYLLAGSCRIYQKPFL